MAPVTGATSCQGGITLLILSNVLYIMTFVNYFHTGMNVKEYKNGNIVQTEVLKARRGSILDHSEKFS